MTVVVTVMSPRTNLPTPCSQSANHPSVLLHYIAALRAYGRVSPVCMLDSMDHLQDRSGVSRAISPSAIADFNECNSSNDTEGQRRIGMIRISSSQYHDESRIPQGYSAVNQVASDNNQGLAKSASCHRRATQDIVGCASGRRPIKAPWQQPTLVIHRNAKHNSHKGSVSRNG